MRIPTSGDISPPLLAPLDQEPASITADGEIPQKSQKRRRGKKSSASADHKWEQAPQSSRLRRGENRKMRMMLVAGGLLFIAIVGGVLVSMLKRPAPVVAGGGQALEQVTQVPEAAPAVPRSEASLLSEAERLAKMFLEASTVDEVLPLVRNPSIAEARMREYYPGGKIEPVGFSKFNPDSGIVTQGKLVSVSVVTREQEERSLGFVDTAEGLKIDWESWVGWSELPWEEFLTTKSTTSHVFRVILSPVDYYNFGFSDEFKWQSYRLESPDKKHGLYGYVEKGSELDKRLRPNADEKDILLTLSLKFPLNPQSNSQVEIERFVCAGWVEEVDSP